MVPVLIAGLIAMVFAVVIGPKFIEMLRARNLGQQIRAEGPATHVVKQGTPTMGGLLILAAAVLPFLALSQYTAEGLTVLFIVLGCALIGFTDDYLKQRRQHSLGPSGTLEDGGARARDRRRGAHAAGDGDVLGVLLHPCRRAGTSISASSSTRSSFS